MVESLSDLNKICQKTDYKTTGNWMVRKILRPAALPITWLLLHTSVTANQVTLAAILTGLLGIALCAGKSAGVFFTGMLLVQFWYLLDHVDGQIARYRGTSGLTGRYFDFLMHHMIHGAFLFPFGYRIFAESGNPAVMIWVFVAVFCLVLFNLSYDIEAKAFYEKILGMREIRPKKSGTESPDPKALDASAAKKAFMLGHKLIEMHVMMNVFTLAALFVLFFPGLDLRVPLFIFYSLLIPACFVTRTVYWIRTKKIDAAFHSEFESHA